MRSLLLLPAALAALALTGCDLRDDGPSRTQTRDVGAFTRLDVEGSVDVRLRVGEPSRLRVRAGEKVIDDVETDVRDGTLHVELQADGFNTDEIVVEASVRQLDGIEVHGSADIEADGIDADAFDLSSEGSADTVLTGRTGALDVEVEGSGSADLADLEARAARVRVRGSGDADVRADERLVADVDGSGSIRYHGDPQLDQRVDGSGDISRAES